MANIQKIQSAFITFLLGAALVFAPAASASTLGCPYMISADGVTAAHCADMAVKIANGHTDDDGNVVDCQSVCCADFAAFGLSSPVADKTSLVIKAELIAARLNTPHSIFTGHITPPPRA